MMLPDPIFVDEALANLDVMEQLLSTLPADGMAMDQVDTIFRCAHSVKGGAAAFGLADISDLMHQAESLLDQWRQKRVEPDERTAGLLRECVDLARACLTGVAPPASAIRSVAAQLRSLANVPTQTDALRQLCIQITGPHRAEAVPAIVALFRDIDGLGMVLSQTGGGAEPWLLGVRCAVSDAELMDLLAMHVERERIAIRPLDSSRADPKPVVRPLPVASVAASVRVTLAQWALLDRLTDELSTVTADMAVRSDEDGEKSHRVDRLRGLATQLRQAVGSIRSAPASELFALVPPLLVNLSSTLGKPFRLSMSGESLQLDRRLIQGLADPLIHLVRNGCDHGIESPERRRLAGKPPEGHITLSVVLRNGRLILEVRDDGQGFSRDRLLQTARAKGMDVSNDAPDQALWPLVFSAGFSTAGAVTPVSGRGVGMDVVRRKVAALGGTVEIDSAGGVGTRITIGLPGSPASNGFLASESV